MWGAYLFAGITIAYCLFVLWYLCPFEAIRNPFTLFRRKPKYHTVAKVPPRWDSILSKPHDEVQDNTAKSS